MKIWLTYLGHSDKVCMVEDCAFKAQVTLHGMNLDFTMCASHAANIMSRWENLELVQGVPDYIAGKGDGESSRQQRPSRSGVESYKYCAGCSEFEECSY